MNQLDSLRLTIAIAIARAKPVDVPTAQFCDSLRSRLSEVSISSSSGSNPTGPVSLNDSVASRDAKIITVEDRVQYLEEQLEIAQAEVDRHRLSADLRNDAPSTSALGKRKALDSFDELEPSSQKRKRTVGQPKDVEASTDREAPSEIAFETILGEVASDLPVQPSRSSLGVLSSLESFLRSGTPTLSGQPISSPRLLSHFERSISHISGLLSSLLGISSEHDPSRSRPTPLAHSTALRGPPPSGAHRKLRASALLLRRLLALNHCSQDSSDDYRREDALRVVTQISDEIVLPLISHFDTLSRAHAERAFGISLLGETKIVESSDNPLPEELVDSDLRPECLALLVGLLHPSKLPADHSSRPSLRASSTASLSSTRRDSSSIFIPLSGTTAAASTQSSFSELPSHTSTTNSSASSSASATAQIWFSDIMVYLASVEILRLITTDEISTSSSTKKSPSVLRAGKSRTREDEDRSEILRMVREETMWYLCALIDACVEVRKKPSFVSDSSSISRAIPPSSVEVMRGAREILIRPLLSGLSRKQGEMNGNHAESDEGCRLGLYEKRLILGAVEVLSGCCGDEDLEGQGEADAMEVDMGSQTQAQSEVSVGEGEATQ